MRGLIFIAGLAGLLAFLVIGLTPRRAAADPECGPASLYEVAAALGSKASRETVFELFRGQAWLTTMFSLEAGARALGLEAEVVRMGGTALRSRKPLGILHLGDAHFVALLGHSEAGLLIADPIEKGRVCRSRWSYRELESRWDGVILVLRTPAPAARPPAR